MKHHRQVERTLFLRSLGSLAAAVLLLDSGPVYAQACVGDCDGSGDVTINELIKGVNIVLGSTNLDECPSFDASGDGAVTVNEIIQGVNAALGGCTAVGTPTPTPTATPTTTPGGTTATEALAGSSAAVAHVAGAFAAVAHAIVAGNTYGDGAATDPLGGGAAACPLGGTASKSGTDSVTVTLTGCRVAAARGAVTLNGTAGFLFGALRTVDVAANFADQGGTPTLTATVNLTGRLFLSGGGQCVFTDADSVGDPVSGTLRSETAGGESTTVALSGTTVRFTIVSFAASCAPAKYSLELGGPATLATSGAATPVPVEFGDFMVTEDASTAPSTVSFTGFLTSGCFGGMTDVSTDEDLRIPAGQLCPTTGTVTAFLPDVAFFPEFHFDAGGIGIDNEDDGTIDRQFNSCLDPALLMCATGS